MCFYLSRIIKALISESPYVIKSGYADSNGGPLAPHASTLANCATPRKSTIIVEESQN